MGCSSRFITLLTAPLPFHPLLRPRSSLLRLALPLSTTPRRLNHSPISIPHHPPLIPIQQQRQFRTQASSIRPDPLVEPPNSRLSHPWPEWSSLIEIVSANGYVNRQRSDATEAHGIRAEDAFVVHEDLPEEFVRAAGACLALARDRSDFLGSLSRTEIEVVVQNGTPFLFKSALDSSRRMRAFLGVGISNVMESDKAQMVDLMKYILSYASNPTLSSDTNNLYSRELVESSVRKLLTELAQLTSGVPQPDPSASPSPITRNAVLKTGDWICPKCSFINFARNTKCFDCEDPRPKRKLRAGDWECPQCRFVNFAKNSKCLECKNPKLEERPTAKDWECPQCDFYNNAKNITCLKCDSKRHEDFPKIIPFREDENRVVVSKERQTAFDQERMRKYVSFVPFPPGYFAKKDKEGSEISSVSGNIVNGDRNGGYSGQQNESRAPGNPNFRSETPSGLGNVVNDGRSGGYFGHENVSPTPGSPNVRSGTPSGLGNVVNDGQSGGYFRQENVSQAPGNPNVRSENSSGLSNTANDGRNGGYSGQENVKSRKSLEGSGVKESDPLDMSEEAKAERWFRRVAQIKDISELSQIPDEDFPTIMPMRKGVNRFVVSKRKTPLERRLTSPQYRRNLPTVRSDPRKEEEEDDENT